MVNDKSNEYYISMKLENSFVNTVNVIGMVSNKASEKSYRISRIIDETGFTNIKAQFYAGLLALYYDNIGGEYTEQEEVKNLFCCMFQTKNEAKVFTYDAYFIEAKDTDELLKSEQLKMLYETYNVDDNNELTNYLFRKEVVNSVLFNYGYTYKSIIDKNELLDNVYHIACNNLTKLYSIDEIPWVESFKFNIIESQHDVLNNTHGNIYSYGVTLYKEGINFSSGDE